MCTLKLNRAQAVEREKQSHLRKKQVQHKVEGKE